MWYAKFNGSLSDYEVNGSNANNFHHYSKKELVSICRTQMLDNYKNPHFEKVDVACVKYTLYIKCALNGYKYAYDFYDLDAINPNDMDEDEYAELIEIRDRIKSNDSDVASASIDSIAKDIARTIGLGCTSTDQYQINNTLIYVDIEKEYDDSSKKFSEKKYAKLIDANTKELLGSPVKLPQSCGHFAYIEPIKTLLLKGINNG